MTDRTVRKIKEMDGKVVIVPNVYSPEELADARKECKAEPTK